MKAYEIQKIELPCTPITDNEKKLAYELAETIVENDELKAANGKLKAALITINETVRGCVE